ncbi:Alpha/Beta hydrolase protein [Podospora conica]|nr:Alpha/Beta hydrolase protein [Schizothecium conicum]
MAADLLARFNRQDIVYKTVNDIPLSAAILTPKSLPPSTTDQKKYPVIVHFHGGALIVGTNPDPAFTSQWLLTLALTTPAILISPQYRLLPEATGTDLMDDISDFWTWFRSPALPARLSPTQVLAAGESAGGYLSIQSALLFNPAAGIRAVAATYPAQYPDVAAYNVRHSGVVVGGEDDAVVDAYLGAVRRGEKKVRVSTPWGTYAEGEGLIQAMGPTGRHREMMGGDGRLTLGGGLEVARGRGGEGAAVWIVQGREDDLVVKEGADEVVERIREAVPGMPVKYTVEEGGHVFDLAVGLDEPWVEEGVEFVRKYWLGNDGK